MTGINNALRFGHHDPVEDQLRRFEAAIEEIIAAGIWIICEDLYTMPHSIVDFRDELEIRLHLIWALGDSERGRDHYRALIVAMTRSFGFQYHRSTNSVAEIAEN